MISETDTARILALFAANTTRTESGCICWTGRRNRGGYGQIRVGKRLISAHRVAWELANGEVPDGLGVLHRCDVRNCINTEHHFLGTHADNMADMVAKKRHQFGERHHWALLSNADAITISERLSSGAAVSALASEYNVSRGVVHSIQRGISWRTVTDREDERPALRPCEACGADHRGGWTSADGRSLCDVCSWRSGSMQNDSVRCAPRSLPLARTQCLSRQLQEFDGYGDGKCAGCQMGIAVATALGVSISVPDQIREAV